MRKHRASYVEHVFRKVLERGRAITENKGRVSYHLLYFFSSQKFNVLLLILGYVFVSY